MCPQKGYSRKIPIFAEKFEAMSEIPRWEQKLQSYHKALNRLAEVVNEMDKRQLNDFEADGLIQRFEFTFELAWKLIKSYAEYQGTDKEIMGSRDAIRWAYENHLISDSATWMEMIKRRNDTSHTYDEDTAVEVVSRVKASYFQAFVASEWPQCGRASWKDVPPRVVP